MVGSLRRNMTSMKVAFLVICIATFDCCLASNSTEYRGNMTKEDLEQRLHAHIFENYKRDAHPAEQREQVNASGGVAVVFDVQVIRILEVNERQQYIKVYLWVNQYWKNSRLGWDMKDYPGISSIYVSPEKVWVPDIVLYNSVDGNGQNSGGLNVYKHKVRIASDGRHDWLNPVVFKSICQLDVSYFPFDDQKCKLKFGSWAHDASRIEMRSPSETTSANSYYIPNGEWKLLRITTKENIKKYQCCKNPFADVTVTVNIRRQAINYTLTLILPCALLSSLVVLGFILPPESGERIGLSITVLLAVTVFQQLTSQIMPPYDFPYLAQYYLATIMETGFSLIVTTLILNFYHRSYRRMPWLLRKIVLDWLAPVLFCRRAKQEDGEDPGSCEYEMGMQEKMKRRRQSSVPEVIVDWNKRSSIGPNSDDSSGDTDIEVVKNRRTSRREMAHEVSYSNGNRAKNKFIKVKLRNLSKRQRTKSVLNQSLQDTAFTLLTPDTKKKIADYDKKMKEDWERMKRSKEWLKAARVLDRLFLVLFVIVSTASLLIIFFRAPRFSNDRNV